jgi:hypothetical protein
MLTRLGAQKWNKMNAGRERYPTKPRSAQADALTWKSREEEAHNQQVPGGDNEAVRDFDDIQHTRRRRSSKPLIREMTVD